MTAEGAGAVIVAAGAGQRFGGNKVFAALGGRPLLAYAVEVFQRCQGIETIALVLAPANVADGEALVRDEGWTKVAAVCAGGARRQDSVRAGLLLLPPCGWVAIHDGARPFVTGAMIEAGIIAARRTGAAVAAVPAKDTIKMVGPDGTVEGTPDRSRLWLAQTPQIFRYELILRAYQEARAEVTDDAALLEQRGLPVVVYPGSYENIKITTPEDMALAEWIVRERREG